MPYLKSTCIAGLTKEYELYHSFKFNEKNPIRNPKINKTIESQKKVNLRQAEKKVRRQLNANFCGDDWYLTLKYQKDLRPKTKEELRKHIDKFLRGLRRIYKKEGKVLKYIWVAEIGEKGAVHIHIVINQIDLSKVKKLWPYGFITITPMDSSGQYKKLASYFIKYSEKTLKTTGELQGKRWNPSKSLIRPIEKKKPIRCRNKWSNTIKVPDGWYLDKESIREGIHELTGFPYLNYTLIKIPGKIKKSQKGYSKFNIYDYLIHDLEED